MNKSNDQLIYNNYSMSPSWIWSDKITNERVARVGYNHFISNKSKWNNCFSKFSPYCLFCHSSQFSSRSRAFRKGKEMAATQASNIAGNLTKIFQKSQMSRGLPGGHGRFWNWPVHYETIVSHSTKTFLQYSASQFDLINFKLGIEVRKFRIELRDQTRGFHFKVHNLIGSSNNETANSEM